MEEDFAELLKTYRKDMGWTQARLSEKWSYSFETISSAKHILKNLTSLNETGTEARIYDREHLIHSRASQACENSRKSCN